MGRVQDPNEGKGSGRKRVSTGEIPGTPSSSKKRKPAPDNENVAKVPKYPAKGGAEATPSRASKSWAHDDELKLVKLLYEHRLEGRALPLASKTAVYWTELITLLYPGEDGITQRRLYDKVRRMHHKYSECRHVLQVGETPWKNEHERTLFEYWEKIFVDAAGRPTQPKSASKPRMRANGKKTAQVPQNLESSSEEEDQEECEKQRSAPGSQVGGNLGPKGRQILTEESSGEEEEDEDDSEEEDERHREMRTVVSQVPTQSRIATQPGSSSQFKEANGNGKYVTKMARDPSVMNGAGQKTMVTKRVGSKTEGGVVTVRAVRALKEEILGFVRKLRDDCVDQLDEIQKQLLNPARLSTEKRRQELLTEELSLQQSELEIGRRYCHLQKEAMELQTAS